MKKVGGIFLFILVFCISSKAQTSFIYKYRIVFTHNFSAKLKDATDHVRTFAHAFNIEPDGDGFFMVFETFDKIEQGKLTGKMQKVSDPVSSIKLLSQVTITDEQRRKLEELHLLQEAERIAAGK
jgi:hypothetical protein